MEELGKNITNLAFIELEYLMEDSFDFIFFEQHVLVEVVSCENVSELVVQDLNEPVKCG